MSTTRAAVRELPALPLTVEGASVLHQMMRLRWADWKKLPQAQQRQISDGLGKRLLEDHDGFHMTAA